MKLVIFDCDGTLVDSQHMIAAAMDEAFRSEGLAPPPRPAIVGVVGLSLPLAISRLLPEAADHRLVNRLSDAYKASFAARRQSTLHDEPLYPGVRDAIRDLAARDDVRLGIATGKSVRGVRAVLEREGFAGTFATVQTADTHPSKPDPSMILAAMAEVGAKAAGTAMIGDTTFDIEMARYAGVAAIGVAWGYHPPASLIEAGAHAVADDCGGLARALDRLLFDLEAA